MNEHRSVVEDVQESGLIDCLQYLYGRSARGTGAIGRQKWRARIFSDSDSNCKQVGDR